MMNKQKEIWRNDRYQVLINNLLLSVPLLIFLITLSILVFNIDRAFDITDESFNLLWATQPEYVNGSITQFGYYTGFLYQLSGENIAIFRLLGVFLLLIIATVFSLSLERYWQAFFSMPEGGTSKLTTLLVMLISIVAYYKDWRWLTPTYNWLVIVGISIVFIGLLEEATRALIKNEANKHRFKCIINGLLVGVGLGLTFLAKPPVPVLLCITIFFWIILHPMLRNRIFFLSIALFSSIFVLVSHIYFYGGGFLAFYENLQYGLELGAMRNGHSKIGTVLENTALNIQWIAVDSINTFTSYYTGLNALIFIALYAIRKEWNQTVKIIFPVVISIILIQYWHQLYVDEKWTRAWIGYSGLQFTCLLGIFSIISWLTFKNNLSSKSSRPVFRIVILNLFLISLTFTFSFGTSNDIWVQMSAAYIFLSAGAIYGARWIDGLTGNKILSSVLSVLISLSVLSLVKSQYENPRRQIAGISHQNNKVSFIAGGGELLVDKVTAKYINDLKAIATESGWHKGMRLIDMTGGTPGATFILGGRVTGAPWLLGAYPGSDIYSKTVLQKIPKSLLKSAWVLFSPTGKRSISSSVLLDLGLDFPNGYKAIGQMKTGHRDELQILWKPLYNSGMN